MKKDADELEKYLAEFRPRAVRPLQLPQPAGKAWLRALAVAAVLVICAGGALWYGRSGANTHLGTAPEQVEAVPSSARPSLISLTRLALENDEQFQAQLAAESRQVLPRLQGSQSTLSILAKE